MVFNELRQAKLRIKNDRVINIIIFNRMSYSKNRRFLSGSLNKKGKEICF